MKYTEQDNMLQHGIGNYATVHLKMNHVIEVSEGVGIVIDASSILMEQCFVKKCINGGMLVQSSQIYKTQDSLQ